MVDAFISVRANSSRLNRKCFKNIHDMSVLMGVIYRCLSNGIKPIITTTIHDDEVKSFARLAGINYIAGHTDNRVARWLLACQELSIDKFITIDCDDPLFDPAMAIVMYNQIDEKNIIKPNMDYYLGSNGWAFKSSTLMSLYCEKSNLAASSINNFAIKPEGVNEHVKSVVDEDKCTCLTVDEPKEIEKRLRLTLDYEEDLVVISTFIRELGWLASRKDIIEFAQNNKGLLLANEFRIKDWKKYAA